MELPTDTVLDDKSTEWRGATHPSLTTTDHLLIGPETRFAHLTIHYLNSAL